MIKLSRKGLFMKLKIVMTLLFAAFLFSSLENSIEKGTPNNEILLSCSFDTTDHDYGSDGDGVSPWCNLPPAR